MTRLHPPDRPTLRRSDPRVTRTRLQLQRPAPLHQLRRRVSSTSPRSRTTFPLAPPADKPGRQADGTSREGAPDSRATRAPSDQRELAGLALVSADRVHPSTLTCAREPAPARPGQARTTPTQRSLKDFFYLAGALWPLATALSPYEATSPRSRLLLSGGVIRGCGCPPPGPLPCRGRSRCARPRPALRVAGVAASAARARGGRRAAAA
jgi:hypothetical protein